MAPALPRTSFNSSRLVRLLADLDVADVAESKQSFAERLSLWLDFTNAISLSGALKAGAASGLDSQSAAAEPRRAAVREEFARVRATLVGAINTEELLKAAEARIKFASPAPGASADGEADFSPYHRYYLARQRDMEVNIGPLRTNVRAALSSFAPTLKQLAALDAVLDEALRARERHLLSSLPLLLAKRFEHLRRTHQAALAETQTADSPERWIRLDGWLANFCRDMQNLLLAELELRLQPVAGLIEALGNEVTKHQ